MKYCPFSKCFHSAMYVWTAYCSYTVLERPKERSIQFDNTKQMKINNALQLTWKLVVFIHYYSGLVFIINFLKPIEFPSHKTHFFSHSVEQSRRKPMNTQIIQAIQIRYYMHPTYVYRYVIEHLIIAVFLCHVSHSISLLCVYRIGTWNKPNFTTKR